ncbi:MAG TPA: MFS transporter [Candidatus Acidoferrales bacterium]|nr:MFS transporter [Candidatus Acidoferrales bacterium]
METEKPSEQPLYPEAAVSTPAAATILPGLPGRLFAPTTGMLRALRHRNYRLFWAGNFLSNIGTWMHQVALGWLVIEMTNSAFLLGLTGFAQWTPALLFSLPAGVMADRVDRRRWLLLTQTVMMVVALALAVSVTLKIVTFREVLVIAFLLGTASAVTAPAYQAMVRDLSSREDVLNAIAMNSMQFNLSRFIGPSIAGILVSTVGLASCFYINAVSFLAPLLALSWVRYTPEPPTATGSTLERLVEGIHYLRAHKHVFLLIGIVAMVSLFGLPYLVFLPVFARDVLQVGARGLGYMTSASGGGALLGALLLATWPQGRRRGPLVLGGTLVFFSAVLLVAVSRNFYLSIAALVVAGGAMVCSVATINSLIQTLVPDQVRGRVLSWHTMAYFGGSPLGSLLVGSLAYSVGTPMALAISAAGPLLVTVGMLASLRWLRHLK